MAVFFIDTSTGRVATHRQLIDAGVTNDVDPPPRPWHRIQGTNDATTMWYAVLRRQEKGVYIGALVLRHSDHYASLLDRGWEEVAVQEISAA
jgi:alpha/beta superfamily hydrolase